MENKKVALAIVSLILGVVGLVFSFIPILNNMSFVMGIIGIVFGVVAFLTHNKRGLTIAGVIACILSCGITLALQASWSKSIDEINQSLDDATGENTDDILGRDVDVQIGAFTSQSDAYGISSTELPVTVVNLLNESASFTVQIEAVNPDGSRLATDYVYANNLGAGQSMNEKVFTFISSDEIEAYQNASYQVIEVTKF